MKKLFAIMLVAIMMVGLVVPSFAAETAGTITINNALPEKTYSIYRIFDLYSYDKDLGAYIYKVNADWDLFTAEEEFTKCFSVNPATDVVTNKAGADLAQFAKDALAFAEDNGIDYVDTKTATSTSLVFDGLELGYYLVDSSAGALCSLNTTDTSVEIEEKNGEPTIDKKVKLDGEDASAYSEENSGQIGDIVNFMVKILPKQGAQNYVLHDTMGKGLTFINGSIKVSMNAVNVPSANNYTVLPAQSDGCTFHIAFSETFCDSLTGKDTIVVTYNAVINDEAAVSTDKNNNKAVLTYGDNHKDESETNTYTYKVQVIKTDATPVDGKYTLLEGAEFKVYKQATGGTPLNFRKTADGVYKLVTDDYSGNDPVSDIIEAGQPIIEGLYGNYWLEEVKAPNGYNLIETRIPFSVTKNNVAGDGAIVENKYNSSITGGIQVKNAKGNRLPSTGSVGTVAIYVGGTALLLLACGMILTVSRRKENN